MEFLIITASMCVGAICAIIAGHYDEKMKRPEGK